MSCKSLRIRRCCGLLANDNPVSTLKRRRIVGVFTLGTCEIPTAYIGIGGRENAPQVRKMVCVYAVDLRSKCKPGFTVVSRICVRAAGRVRACVYRRSVARSGDRFRTPFEG